MTLNQQPENGDFAAELSDFRQRLDDLRRLLEDGALEPSALLQELESAHEELRVADEEVRAQQEEIDRLLTSRHTQKWLHERLVAALPVPVLGTDERGMVRSANSAAAALLEIRHDLLLAKPVFSFVDPADRPQLRWRLVGCLASEHGFRTTITVLPRRSPPLSVELAVTCTGAPGGTAVTWVLLTAHARSSASTEGRAAARLSRALAELTGLNVHQTDTGTLLAEVARICEQAFAVPLAVSITLGPPGEPELVATRSKVAQAVDGAQMASDEGPCRSAWEENATVVTDDVRTDRRWPRLTPKLQRLSVRSVVAAPVRVGETVLGTLALYGNANSLAGEGVVRDAELLAGAVAAILHEHDVKAELETLTRQLQEAMQSRAGIEQAKGILMALYRCTPDRAFAMLAKLSSDRNVKLRDIARQMVIDASAGPDRPDRH